MNDTELDPRFVRFLESADLNALRSWLGDYRMLDHLAVVDALSDLFDQLRHGEQPAYETVDWQNPLLHSGAAGDLLRWVCLSGKADVQSLACDLGWRIGTPAAVDAMEGLLHAGEDWLVAAARDALARMGSPAVDAAIELASDENGSPP